MASRKGRAPPRGVAAGRGISRTGCAHCSCTGYDTMRRHYLFHLRRRHCAPLKALTNTRPAQHKTKAARTGNEECVSESWFLFMLGVYHNGG